MRLYRRRHPYSVKTTSPGSLAVTRPTMAAGAREGEGDCLVEVRAVPGRPGRLVALAESLTAHLSKMQVVDLSIVPRVNGQRVVLRLGGTEEPRRGFELVLCGERHRQAFDTTQDCPTVGQLRGELEPAMPQPRRLVDVALAPVEVTQCRYGIACRIQRAGCFGDRTTLIENRGGPV